MALRGYLRDDQQLTSAKSPIPSKAYVYGINCLILVIDFNMIGPKS
jgi:hypothetical protein